MAKQRQSVQKRDREYKKRQRELKKAEKAALKLERRLNPGLTEEQPQAEGEEISPGEDSVGTAEATDAPPVDPQS